MTNFVLFAMRVQYYLAALLSIATFVLAVPAIDSAVKPNAGLRLIKTSATDLGTWVTEDGKISNYAAKKIAFVDITDIKDPETLARLSSSSANIAPVAAITYPTTLSHQTEANALIAKTNTNGPQSWLMTLTK